MPTTRARSVRRAAVKRTILSALDENQPSNDNVLPTTTASTITTNKQIHASIENVHSENNKGYPQQKPFSIPEDCDTTDSESINILLEDIEKEVKRLQENVAIKCCEAIKKQHQTYFLKTMKIEKSVKKMTIREFNEKFMKKNVRMNNTNNDGGESQENDIVALMKSVMIEYENSESNTGFSTLGKKRFRNDMPGMNTAMNMIETPARPLRVGNNMRTPATVLRTAKRGEKLVSANGSPIEQCEDGALIATVTKKRRAHGVHEAAMFDINVGGNVISLSDPSAMSHLSNEMKTSVSAQLSVLQDQISKLMTQMES